MSRRRIFLTVSFTVKVFCSLIALILGLETLVEGNWYPVVSYDTSHGFAHRDLINRKGEAIKTPIFIQDYNDALTFAESDLKANWEIYEERFLKE